MEFLFGKQKSPADRVKEYNRSIKRSVRELDRERQTLERQEKKLMSDIKKAAKDGQARPWTARVGQERPGADRPDTA